MAVNFKIPEQSRITEQTLAKGFGLPLVKRAFINAEMPTQSDKPDATSLFGTPLYGTLFFESPAFFNYEYDEFLQKYTQVATVYPSNNKQIGGKNGCFIEGVIIEVNQNRNIVTTAIAGQDGTVKEFINNGDYQVSIRGYFADKNPDVYPAVDVRTLGDYIKAPVPLKTTNIFLNDYFGITDLVVTSFSFHQQEGVRNVQYFQLECLSDITFEIKSNKSNV